MEYVENGKDCITGKAVEIAPHDTWEGLDEIRPEPDDEANVYENDEKTGIVKRIL